MSDVFILSFMLLCVCCCLSKMLWVSDFGSVLCCVVVGGKMCVANVCILHNTGLFGVPPPALSQPTFRQLKSCRVHSLQVPSADDVASTWSTGEKQTAQTPRRWPRNTPSKLRSAPAASDHSLAVRSWEPDASSLSLGDTATLLMSCGGGKSRAVTQTDLHDRADTRTHRPKADEQVRRSLTETDCQNSSLFTSSSVTLLVVTGVLQKGSGDRRCGNKREVYRLYE